MVDESIVCQGCGGRGGWMRALGNRQPGVVETTTVPTAPLAPRSWAGPGCFTPAIRSESHCSGVMWLICLSCWAEYLYADEYVCVSGAS